MTSFSGLPSRLAIGLTLIIFLSTGCSSGPESKSREYDPLPPLKAERQKKKIPKENIERKKISRRVYRLDKKEYDIVIVYKNPDGGGLFSPAPPEIGFAIHCADINGDKIDDIIIGAPYPEGLLKSRKSSGKVYVIFGRRRMPKVIDLRAADLIFYRTPPEHSSRFGQSIATGDLNGDGIKDLIMGAPHSSGDQGIFRSGEVYIVFGRKKMSGKKNILKVADAIIYGSKVSDETGFAVASGDLNGDGLDDLIIGAPGANRDKKVMAGQTYVIFGRPKIPKRISLSISRDVTLTGIDGPNSYMLNMMDPPDRSGSALATGDVNSDGLDDLIIAAPYANGPNNDREGAGEVYVVFGQKNMRRTVDLASEPDITIWGAFKRDHSGYSLSTGDFNGDGIDDIAIGTGKPIAGEGKKNWQAAAYLVHGSKNPPNSIDLIRDADLVLKDLRKIDTSFLGKDKNVASYYRGYSVAMGDLNQDGLAELATGTSPTSGSRGRAAFIVSGKTRHPRIIKLFEKYDSLILQKTGDDPQNHSVATGDVNGDGRGDLLIRAPGPSRDDGRREGYIYIILGRD